MKNRIWITTDTHFGHDKLVEYSGRPENHSELVILGLQKNIDAGDTLIHLGDICIGKDEQWHNVLSNTLPGVKRILVKGNHDGKSNAWYLSHGWDFVCDKFEDTYFGKKIVFSHIPVKDDDEFDLNIHGHFHNNLHRLLQGDYRVEGEKERNMVHLSLLTPKHKLLAIENTKYQPVLLESFISPPPCPVHKG